MKTVVRYNTETGAIRDVAKVYVCSVPPEELFGKVQDNPGEDVLVIDGIVDAAPGTHVVEAGELVETG